ncbi:MAG: RIP metalloprotease RseP, partial [Bdellovibrionales bacterium]|nr:RIP metalloprotease RseP [Bdellovibrionales bacterium]
MDLVIHYIQQTLSSIGPFVLLLGLLVFVHELGHFVVAKWCGVRVEVFSLGFGKKLLQYKHGDTVYCISMIPLGGYVKMYGDNFNADVPEEEKAKSFIHKPVSQRIAVVLAGPLMNLIFAVFLFTLIGFIGDRQPAAVVGDIAESSQAYTSGLRAGDHILSVNGQEIQGWVQLTQKIAES